MAILVQSCDTTNIQTDGTCSVPVWVELPAQALPPLSAGDGLIIGVAIVGCWIAGASWKWARKTLE